MSSLFVSAESTGSHPCSGQDESGVNLPRNTPVGARELAAFGRLAPLYRFAVTRSGEVVDCEAERSAGLVCAPLRSHVPTTSFVTTEAIDYRALLHSVRQHGKEPGPAMSEEFSTVMRVVRALMTEQDGKPLSPGQREQCALLLDAVGSWSKQPPDMMHANIERALMECSTLPDVARAMLLGAIVKWDLSRLPEAAQAGDYYRLDRMIDSLTGNARFELSGRLSASLRTFDAGARRRSWIGVSGSALGIPPRETAPKRDIPIAVAGKVERQLVRDPNDRNADAGA